MASGAQRACAFVACAAGALALLVGAADAQSTRTATQAERDRRAEAIRAERLRTEAAAALEEASAIDARLVASAARRAEAEAAATAAEQRLETLRIELAAQTQAQRRARLALESAVMAAALARRRAEPDAVRAGVVARAAAPSFAAAHRRAALAVAGARRLESAIAEEQSILADAQNAIDAERAELALILHQRRAALTSLTREAAAAEARVRRLAAEARSLRELAARVQPAASRAPSGPAGGGGAVPAAWLAPAEGQIARGFGSRQETRGAASQGAFIRTRAGAQVVAPAAGEVTFAGPFRSYGQVLILNMDGGYAVVLTGLDAVGVRVGETVRAGQPIGEMAAADTPAPELYVEVRRGGQPIDPGRWLSARGLAAERSVRAG